MLLKSLFSRKKAIDAGPKLRRLMDLTLPNRPVCNDGRGDQRYNRTLPALICPWVDDQPNLAEASFGISQDCSDSGLRILLFQAVQYDRCLTSFMLTSDDVAEQFHFVCEVRDIRTFAGGMKSVGLLVTELADDRSFSPVNKSNLDALMKEHLTAKE